MSLIGKCNQPLYVLEPTNIVGPSLGVKRSYRVARLVMTHVQPLDAQAVMLFRQQGAQVDHRLWFAANPHLTEVNYLIWRNIVLRTYGDSIDLHGLGVVWQAHARNMTVDNQEPLAYLGPAPVVGGLVDLTTPAI